MFINLNNRCNLTAFYWVGFAAHDRKFMQAFYSFLIHLDFFWVCVELHDCYVHVIADAYCRSPKHAAFIEKQSLMDYVFQHIPP